MSDVTSMVLPADAQPNMTTVLSVLFVIVAASVITAFYLF